MGALLMFRKANLLPEICLVVRESFSPYLDGAVSGVEMASLEGHLQSCAACNREFAEWRSVQMALGELGPARAPERLQARLRSAIATERELGTHLSFSERVVRMWHAGLGEASTRFAGGLTAAIILLGGAGQFLASNTPVLANDDNMAHLIAPRYLYSQVPPRPLETGHDVPVLVQVKVDERGRVYDYTIVAGPADERVRTRVEENLLASVFRPASVFGVPVSGEVIMTYSGISVRG